MCKMMIFPGFRFIFFEILIFWAVRGGARGGGWGVKGQKIAQNEKKQLHPSHVISQKQYNI